MNYTTSVPLKKVFLLTQFGPIHPWTAQYLDHVRTLAPFGYSWKIFTPHAYPSGGNVEVVRMSFNEFDTLVTERTGVVTGNFLGEGDLPVKLTSDYYPAFGDIFTEYLKDCDYWSITNWDVIFGRLDHFLPDEELSKYDIWSDDAGHVNSLFCFYKNRSTINRLYREVPDWRQLFRFEGPPLVGFDEVHFNALVRKLAAENGIRFGHPPYFPLHSYDRLVQHQPEPNLAMMPDGALIECFEDPNPALANYAPWRGYFGREIMYFHFIRSKRWPILRPAPAGRG